MKTLSFWRGIGFAVVISVVGWVLHSALAGFLGSGLAVRLCVLVAALIYLLALLAHGSRRSGRAVAAVAWLALSGLLIVLNPPLTLWLLSQTGFIWLLRSLQRHDSLVAASADALLSGFALAAAIATAQHTHSLLMSLWSYFLVQALAAFIPTRAEVAAGAGSDAGEADFDTYFRNAEAALRRLSLRS